MYWLIDWQDFEFDDFNTNATDEFGFDRQMNWNNSIGKWGKC